MSLCRYLLVTGSSEAEIVALKVRIMKEFEMSDIGTLPYFHGVEFHKTKEKVIKGQKKYATVVLKRFEMINCNSTMTLAEAGLRLGRGDNEDSVDATQYRGKVGSLRYLCNTRLVLVFCVGLMQIYGVP